MPNYTITCRGGLVGPKGVVRAIGSVVEMSEKDAASLPPGTVELKSAPVESKPTPKTEAKASKESKP